MVRGKLLLHLKNQFFLKKQGVAQLSARSSEFSRQWAKNPNTKNDEFTQRMLTAINSMMLDMLAAVARKDYEDRRRRQSDGIAKAKMDGKYRGRIANLKLQENIAALLNAGKSYSKIVNLLGCSRSTISKVRKSTPKP